MSFYGITLTSRVALISITRVYLDLSARLEGSSLETTNTYHSYLLSNSSSLDDLLQPPSMDSLIAGQLRMESGAKHIALPDSNNITILTQHLRSRSLIPQRLGPPRQPTKNLNLGLGLPPSRRLDDIPSPIRVRLPQRLHLPSIKHLLDNGRPNENRMKGHLALQKSQPQIRLETLNLPSEIIPLNPHVQTPDQLLPGRSRLVRALRQQDQARARAPDGFALDFHKLPQRLQEAAASRYQRYGGAFAAGED